LSLVLVLILPRSCCHPLFDCCFIVLSCRPLLSFSLSSSSLIVCHLFLIVVRSLSQGVSCKESIARSLNCLQGVSCKESLARSLSQGVSRKESLARSLLQRVSCKESLARSLLRGVSCEESLARSLL
jgi:hypothetical protein